MTAQPRKFLVIAGNRKAGTTFLFSALAVDWTPGLKDRSWPELRQQIAAFLDSGAPTGAVAKADAIYDAPQLVSVLLESGIDPAWVEIVVLNRDPHERFLSYVAHARKIAHQSLAQARAGFAAEERAAAAGLAALDASPFQVTRLSYESLAAGAETEVAGLRVEPHDSRRNARGEVLPMFGLLRLLVENRVYARVRNTPFLTRLKAFYYKRIARRNRVRNAAIRVAVLGSVAGPVDGQRRITGMFVRDTTFAVSLLDYDGHRRWWGAAKIGAQWLRSLWLAAFGRVDVVYLAISRTRFGLFRDALLLAPLRRAGARVVAHVHGAEFDDFYFGSARYVATKRRQLARVDEFLFLHEALLSSAEELCGRSAVLLNPMPDFAAAARNNQVELTASPPTFGFISAFVPGKGMEDFLALADVLGPRAQMRVAGGAHPKFPNHGSNMEAELTARPDITHMGYIREVASFYQQVDFLVFPTSYTSEALPGVVLEALAFGCVPLLRRTNVLPQIFTDVPIRWFDDRDGLMRVADEVLARAPDEILADKRACKQWVHDRFPTQCAWLEQLERHLVPWDDTP
ncbi:glycosyltransferase family 4 protein [Roseovarius indicus]|uniref:glycosyltransferase family 4 protein n=1 Tax=Roseovarius indicus TaxID=540747 RepID=UPI00351419E0